VFLWSLPIWAFNPAAQQRLLALAPQSGGLVLSRATSAIYHLGIGLDYQRGTAESWRSRPPATW
jgi:hypothetical protein